MPASTLVKLALLCTAITAALAAPLEQARDTTSSCLTADAAATIVKNWKSLLAGDSATQPDQVVTSDYKEYSSSFFALNAYCPQADALQGAKPWSRPVFDGLDAYKDGLKTQKRAHWTWQDGVQAVECNKIALQGGITLVGDGTQIPAIAFLETKSDGAGGPKVAALHWEFDDALAQQVLVDWKQCYRPKVQLPTIL